MKIIIFSFLISLVFAYSPSSRIAHIFKKCDQVLNKGYYINCYSYKYKGPIAIAYELTREDLEKPKIKNRPSFRYDVFVDKYGKNML